MSELAGLALRSLWNRRGTAVLTVVSIAVSIALLLGVQKLRSSAQEGFASTISGTDLIVGARGSPVGLLLYSIFRIGDPTTNVSWQTYQMVARHRDVAWTVPLALGDSHRGYRVIGTSPEYFEHYRYARTRRLEFAAGRAFGAEEVVLGSEVARVLGYRLGDAITVEHGIGAGSFLQHEANPLRVAGILAATGTPVDRALHVSLDTLARLHGSDGPLDSITAFLVGMQARETALLMQRALNEYRGEAVQAVIPGLALAELWRMLGAADRALLAVSSCVVLAGLLGMLSALMTALHERRREMSILRSVGARPSHVFQLLVLEAGLLAAAGTLLGIVLAYGALSAAAPLLERRLGLLIRLEGLTAFDAQVSLVVILAAMLLGTLPAWRAYRNALADGLAIRL